MRSLLLTTAVAALAASTSAGHLGRRGGKSHSHPEKRDPKVLMPIRGAAFDSDGIVKRAPGNFEGLNPTEQAQMLFGNADANGKMNVANMTLYAQDGRPIVLMEQFDDMTSAVDCEGDDGELSLTFKTNEAYEKAIGSWSYIHEDTDAEFLIITNHPGCNPEDERQPYTVTDVDNDDAKNKVILKAESAPWDQVAGTFDLDFGTADVPPAALRAMRKRGIGDWFSDTWEDVKDTTEEVVEDVKDTTKDVVEDVKDVAEDLTSADLDKSVDIDISMGEENKEDRIFKDPTKFPPRLELYCTNCFVKGTFKVTGKLKINNFKAEEMSLEVVPEEFRAAMEMRADIIATKSADLDFNNTLLEAPVPGAGIVVPKILSLGATVSLNFAAGITLFGKTSFSFGGSTNLPKGSRVNVDLVNFDKSAVTGFDKIETEKFFDLDAAQISVDASVAPEPTISLGIDIMDKFGFEVNLKFGVPRLNINATVAYDDEGLCEEDKSITSGIKVKSAANFDMWLKVEGKAGKKGMTVYENRLVHLPIHNFIDECFPKEGLTAPNEEGETPTTVSSVATPKATGDAASPTEEAATEEEATDEEATEEEATEEEATEEAPTEEAPTEEEATEEAPAEGAKTEGAPLEAVMGVLPKVGAAVGGAASGAAELAGTVPAEQPVEEVPAEQPVEEAPPAK